MLSSYASRQRGLQWQELVHALQAQQEALAARDVRAFSQSLNRLGAAVRHLQSLPPAPLEPAEATLALEAEGLNCSNKVLLGSLDETTRLLFGTLRHHIQSDNLFLRADC